MKKSDAIIYAILLAAAAVMFILWSTQDSQALTARIYVEGELYNAVSLHIPAEISVSTSLGHNIIRLEEGSVRMISADCRSQDCIRMGAITRPGRLIACLPNRVIVQLEGDAGEGDIDAIAG